MQILQIRQSASMKKGRSGLVILVCAGGRDEEDREASNQQWKKKRSNRNADLESFAYSDGFDSAKQDKRILVITLRLGAVQAAEVMADDHDVKDLGMAVVKLPDGQELNLPLLQVTANPVLPLSCTCCRMTRYLVHLGRSGK